MMHERSMGYENESMCAEYSPGHHTTFLEKLFLIDNLAQLELFSTTHRNDAILPFYTAIFDQNRCVVYSMRCYNTSLSLSHLQSRHL